jgi:ABC-type transporter Mla MlaB component
MLKISEPLKNHAVTLKLEGRLIGPWVNELRVMCENYLANERPVKLDFADVSYADRGGVALLIDLQERGVELMNCSSFLAEELKAGP